MAPLRRVRHTRATRFRRRYNVKRYRPYRHVRRFKRTPVRRRALRRVQDHVKFTVKNNVNTLMVWPVSGGTIAPGVNIATWTNIPLTIEGLAHANRQFDRNLDDYRWVKFNYVAFKVTDICHIPHSVAASFGEPPVIIPIGVNDMCGRVPVNINWDVDQDFTSLKGNLGTVDPEGFAQHPATKTMRPNSRKPVSFVWKVPKPWRHFVASRTVKETSGQNLSIDKFFETLTGVKPVRFPGSMYFSIPDFWSTFLPYTDNPGVSIKTYIRINVYMGCTFKGRRLMDDGSCTIGHCYPPEINSDMKDFCKPPGLGQQDQDDIRP